MAVWRTIEGYEELYAVSDDGEVISYHKLKPRENNCGYLCVVLCKQGQKPKQHFIHRLVAKAFLSNENDLPHVNHIDKDRHNNSADNLEWCTPKENNLHAHGRRVSQYDLLGNKLAEYASLTAASKITNIEADAISHCCRGVSKTSGGYVWKYTEEEH